MICLFKVELTRAMVCGLIWFILWMNLLERLALESSLVLSEKIQAFGRIQQWLPIETQVNFMLTSRVLRRSTLKWLEITR